MKKAFKKERVIKILIHPFFIGLFVSALILGITMPEISRYKAVVEETIHYGQNTQIFFDDLDNDNQSEEINVDQSEALLKVMLFRGALFIEQYNLKSQPIPGKYFFAGDYNQDGFKELFFFTRHNDSILLSVIDPLVMNDFLLKDRLIFYHDTVHFELDRPEVIFTALRDFTGDGNREFVFSIISGYSKQPRTLYCYDIVSDKLLKSPKSGANITSCRFADLDSDTIPEIIVATNATGNYEMEYPFRDYSSWLMVMNQKLEFHFPPVEFAGYPSSLITALQQQGDSTYIVVLHDYYGQENLKPGLYLYNSAGTLIRSRPLDLLGRSNYYLFQGSGDLYQELFLVNEKEHKVFRISRDLTLEAEKRLPALFNGRACAELDVDGDGKKEPLFLGGKFGTLVVFRQDFSHPLTIDLGEEQYPEHLLTLNREGKVLLFLGFRNNGYLVEYRSNPLYFAKFPFSIVVYLLISFLILLIYRIQHYRAAQQYETQRRISELQILSLKNQIDPHFTFNILNSMGHMFTKSDLKEKAYEIFVQYSRLLRKTVENSHKSAISLSDELEFVRSYIELEQLRSDHSFKYTLEMDERIDLKRSIPRMLIHTFVENAIKHGIRQREPKSEGELKISATKAPDHYKITIRDNGPGLHNLHESSAVSTGRGLHIIHEITELFYKLTGVRISYETAPHQILEDDMKWTQVLINIPISQ
ncbi:MAG: histidine kinase [Bacteroidota bacterium]